MKRNRVNVLTVVNSASNITTETIDGKPHIVVRGITPVVDDIVMNRKLYPAAEIEKAYNTLERNPMPLGQPQRWPAWHPLAQTQRLRWLVLHLPLVLLKGWLWLGPDTMADLCQREACIRSVSEGSRRFTRPVPVSST